MNLEDKYSFGPFRLDTKANLLYCKGEPVELSEQKCRVLRVLLDHRDEVVTYETFLKEAWGQLFDHSNPRDQKHQVTVHIGPIQKALGQYGGCIKPAPGRRGYRFSSPHKEEARSENTPEHHSGARAGNDRAHEAASHAIPIDDTTGIIQIADDWRTLRDSAEVHALVSRCVKGGTLYFVCINPQGFMQWREKIQTALCDGVKLRLAYVDVEHAASAGKAAKWYAASMCITGVPNAAESTRFTLGELGITIDNARQQTGSDPDVQIYRSSFPHPFLCAIYKAPASPGAHLGWGLVSSYLMFAEATHHNFGMLFAEPGTIYDRYLGSVGRYFGFLKKNAVADSLGDRKRKKSKLR